MPSRDCNPGSAILPGRDTTLRIPPTDWYRSFSAAGLLNPVVHGPLGYWLKLEGSLTRALQLKCRENFRVDVLREGFAPPTLEEACTLGIPLRQKAWIREVCLYGDGAPWVLARTIIPLGTLAGKGRRLRSLGRRPLGAYLFSNPEWQRGPFETGLCQRRDDTQPLAARRSRFFRENHALLVGEYFLPTLCT